MLRRRLGRSRRARAHPVMKDREADDFKREEDAVGKVCRGLDSVFFFNL